MLLVLQASRARSWLLKTPLLAPRRAANNASEFPWSSVGDTCYTHYAPHGQWTMPAAVHCLAPNGRFSRSPACSHFGRRHSRGVCHRTHLSSTSCGFMGGTASSRLRHARSTPYFEYGRRGRFCRSTPRRAWSPRWSRQSPCMPPNLCWCRSGAGRPRSRDCV